MCMSVSSNVQHARYFTNLRNYHQETVTAPATSYRQQTYLRTRWACKHEMSADVCGCVCARSGSTNGHGNIGHTTMRWMGPHFSTVARVQTFVIHVCKNNSKWIVFLYVYTTRRFWCVAWRFLRKAVIQCYPICEIDDSSIFSWWTEIIFIDRGAFCEPVAYCHCRSICASLNGICEWMPQTYRQVERAQTLFNVKRLYAMKRRCDKAAMSAKQGVNPNRYEKRRCWPKCEIRMEAWSREAIGQI